MENKKLPYYNIVMNSDESGLDFVSFVADPAIMEMGLAFAKAAVCDPVSNKLSSSSFKFDSEKQIVVGPAMIPDVPLYRNEDGEEFYVVFTKEVIDQLSEKFNKTPKEYKINLDHADEVQSAFIKSNWIIEDKANDKSNMYGFNLPEGTWMLEVKVSDSKFWQDEIKAQGKFGFSVEGLFQLDYIGEFNKSNKLKMEITDLTPEEVALIEKMRAEAEAAAVAPEEVVAAVEDAVEDIVAEEAPDPESPAEDTGEPIEAAEEAVVEDAEEAVVEDAPAPTPEAETITTEMIQEMIDAKYNDLLEMIAELKTTVEAPAEEAIAMSKTPKESALTNFKKVLEMHKVK